MEITKFHRAAKIRAQRGPAPYSRKQVCRGNKTGINLHERVGNNGRETGVHRRERKQRNTLSLSLSLRFQRCTIGIRIFSAVRSRNIHSPRRNENGYRSPHPPHLYFAPLQPLDGSVPHDPMQSCRAVLSVVEQPSSFHLPFLFLFLLQPSLAFHSTLFLRKHPVKLAFPTFFATLFSAESNTFPPSNRETNSKRAKRIFFTFRTFVYSG